MFQVKASEAKSFFHKRFQVFVVSVTTINCEPTNPLASQVPNR